MLLDLKSMNEKQRLKEFKSTQKDIKSKDLSVKSTAIAKCKEETSYFIDGGCFIPLVVSTLPKKKALEVPTVALDFLAEYFYNHAVKVDNGIGHSQLNIIFEILRASFEKDEKFEFMQTLTEILKFKEEKKVKKIKPKKGEPIPPEEPFIEDVAIVHVRNCALKCLYRIIQSFLVIPTTLQVEIKKAFASIEGLYGNIFNFMREFLVDISQHENLQNAVYALSNLVFTLRYNPAAVDAFITESGDNSNEEVVDQLSKSLSEVSLGNAEEKLPKKPLLLILQTLSKSEPLSLYCIQALELLCYRTDGLLLLSKEENKEFIISELDRCLKGLHVVAEAAAAAAAAAANHKPGKEVKKDDKGKKGADHGHAHAEKKPVELEIVKVDPTRNIACTVKLLCKVVTEMAQKNKDAIDAAATHKIGVIASQLLVSHPLWELARDEHSHKPPLDELVFDVIEELCIMVGSIGFIVPENRCALVESGCLQSLITVMQQSRPIITGVEELSPGKTAAAAAEKEKALGGKGKAKADAHNAHTTHALVAPELSGKMLKKLFTLRRVCEKAILNLSTDPKGTVLPRKTTRWTSATNYCTDESAFLPHSDANKFSFFAELLDLVTFLNDNDLATRGVRMIAAVLFGCEDPAVFIRKLNMDHPIALILTAFCKIRGVAVSDGISANLNKFPAVQETIAPSSELDLLISTDHSEPLFLAYSIMETMLLPAVANCVEAVKIFATEEHVKIVSKLLELLGPANASTLPTQRVAEFQAKLFDPRSYSWRVIESESTSEPVFVRPILLRTLSLSAAADMAYRQYESPDALVPPLPCTPVPLSISPCADAALYVCKFSSDVVFAILSKHSLYKEILSNLSVVPIPNMIAYSESAADESDVSANNQRLEESVLIAALEYVVALGSCGVIGLAGALEAIAENGFKLINSAANPDKAYGMKALSLYLKSTITLEDSASRFDSLTWTRPILFDEVFPSTAENSQFSATAEVVNRPLLWPFIAISGGLISIFADPKSTVQATELAVRAMTKLTNFGIQHSHSQPLLCDVLSAVFLSIGGGVALTGLMGRYGNLTAEFSADVHHYAEFLFSRGHERESFWLEWNESHKEPVVLDPKTGKPIVKKDDKKAKETKVDKKVDPKAIPPVIIVPEIQWNLESMDQFPDPNHGPTKSFWLNLLNIGGENLFEVSQAATLLTSAVQGGLQSLGRLLIQRGVSLDAVDGAGLSAIMYSLIYCDEVITEDLINSGADVNAIDRENNSVLKYGLLSLRPEDIDTFLKCHIGYNTSSDGKSSSVEVFGSPRYLSLLLNTQRINPARSPPAVDVNVRDKDGFSPLMTALGQGDLALQLGGYKIHIRSAAYNDGSYPLPTIHGDVRSLIDSGSWLKACSLRGVVPMHIAAARGDLEMIKLFAERNADLNPVDVDGYLPLHFLAACCPVNATAVFNELISMATNRPLEAMVYEDYRSGQTLEYKDKVELDKYIDERFLNAIIPQGIAKMRLSYGDLLATRTNDSLNLLQLCMCAHVVLKSDSKIGSLLKFDKSDRIDLSLHIADCAKNTDGGEDMFSNYNLNGMSVLHSACILLEGVVPQRELTDKEKRSKRVKTYPSKEINLLEWIKSSSSFDVNSWFQWPGETDLKSENWNALLLAIKYDNPALIRFLMDNGFDVSASGVLYLHHLLAIGGKGSKETADLIINICAAQPSYKRLLSEPYDLEGDSSDTAEGVYSMRRPLTVAIRSGNTQLIESLVRCSKVDLNAIDELSQMTAFHEACLTNDSNTLGIIRAFAAGCDRLDMLASAVPDGSNAITAAMFGDRLDILQELLTMRRNDVLECLLSEDDNTPSLLVQLERENIELASKMGYSLKQDSASKGPETWQGADESKGEVTPGEISAMDSSSFPEKTMEKNGQEEQLTVMSDAEKEDIRNKLIKNNALLKVILPVVIESGIITESNHAHSMFYVGQLPIDI